MEDVAVLDFVVLAFGAEEGAFFGFGFGAAIEEVVPGDDFGADEAAFEVAVDATGGALGGRAAFDGPGAAFVVADGEEGSEAEESEGLLEGGFDCAVGDAEVGAVGGGVLGVEAGEFFFEFWRRGRRRVRRGRGLRVGRRRRLGFRRG